MGDVDFSELEGFIDRGGDAVADLVHDVREAVTHAAAEGVREAQGNHPYTDRTYRLTGTAYPTNTYGGDLFPEAEMVWPAEYAGYVDEGTTRARPYPFTPQAVRRADEVLEQDLDAALEKFVGKLLG